MDKTEAYNIAFLILVAPLALYAPYVYWKIFNVYNLLGRRVEKLGFLRFSFQFQLPAFAKGMPGYLDYSDELPDNLKGPVLAIRRRLSLARRVATLWIVFLILTGVAYALFRRQ